MEKIRAWGVKNVYFAIVPTPQPFGIAVWEHNAGGCGVCFDVAELEKPTDNLAWRCGNTQVRKSGDMHGVWSERQVCFVWLLLLLSFSLSASAHNAVSQQRQQKAHSPGKLSSGRTESHHNFGFSERIRDFREVKVRQKTVEEDKLLPVRIGKVLCR